MTHSPRRAVEALILGDSAVIRKLRDLVLRFAPTQLPVLIQGPTGSGKGLVARAIHEASGRVGPFVTSNVAAIGDGLIESELFGHLKGAFTNSTGRRRGLLVHAQHGTAFLDEIHRLSPAAQPKLLRVTESRLIRPVGSDEEVESDFRLICAANEDVEVLAASGRFQEDLLARLSRLVLTVPPLLERKDDIPMLARHLLSGMRGVETTAISSDALSALERYDWPRNVRELAAVLERAAVLCDGPIITRDDILAAFTIGTRPRPNNLERETKDAGRGAVPLSEGDDRERRIHQAFRESDGTTHGAAAWLGVSRQTVYRWLGELGLPTPQRRHRTRQVHVAGVLFTPDENTRETLVTS